VSLRVLAAILAASWPSPIEAAAPARRADARFMHVTVEDGLSQNTVRAILQDRTGFLWFATEEGLNRYDGYAFATFKHDRRRPGTLPDDMTTALYEDRAGRLWVGTVTGLCLFDRRTDTFTVRLESPEVRAILEDRKGALWVATNGGGVYRVDPAVAEPRRYRAEPHVSTSLSHDSVYALLEDRAGRVWVGTYGGGLDLYDPAKDGFVHHRHDPRDPASLSHDEIWSLAEDAAGRIWIGTNSPVLSVLDVGTHRFYHHRARPGDESALQANIVTVVYRDREGTMWVGTDRGGLNRHLPEDGSFVSYRHDPDNPESLSRNAVRAISEDTQGNLWVSTFSGGLNLLKKARRPFAYFAPRAGDPESLSDSAVLSFLEDREGRLWVATAEGGLHRFDPEAGTFARYRLGRSTLLALHEDRKGRIWVGTWGDGLNLFDPARGTFTRQRHSADDPSTARDDQVWDIHEDADGFLWLATDDGIVRLHVDSGRVSRLRHDPGNPASLGHDQVRAFLPEEDSRLWIATLGGLELRRADGTFVHHRHDRRDLASLSHDWVVALHRDGKGGLWVGTFGGGLNRFDPQSGKFTVYTESEGLPSNVVHAILEDDEGALWTSTNKGLSRFRPDTGVFDAFDRSNGLESVQFHLGSRLRSGQGTMYFGTWNGFYHFDPRKITPDPLVPPIVLTSLTRHGQSRKVDVTLSYADEIRLSHRENTFSLEFAVLDYTFPRRNRYLYKLEGLSRDWIPLGTRRDVTFTNLDPGNYVFRVRGSNSDGVWEEKGRTLRVVVTPPFWQTWWCRGLCALAFLGLLFSAHRWRIHRHEARERRLETRVEEALSRVRVLKGLLPICASCKKVRDDKGYWNQMEAYIREHTEADFSHGICPDCLIKHYPEYQEQVLSPPEDDQT
jgi:ligand-binding sensor domain-containing protein